MEDEIKRADEHIPDLKPDDDEQAEALIPATGYRPADSSSCRGTMAIRGGKLHTYDWLDDLPTPPNASDLVEVQFKNTRKAYFRNTTGLKLQNGDIVAVESSPGHDIGTVTLQGRLVYLQMHKNHVNPANYDFKRVYRVAKPADIEKWEEAKGLEHQTMLEARQIAQDLHLSMKIGDVEYQGDRTKAIFYYIADERVDFRQLIKDLAAAFHVRIEMKQIGARQEAGRIGGTGPCGRELCCATWMKSFSSVSTSAARVQDISLNPQKLAGMCAKLKCCLNYEVDDYLDAARRLPPKDVLLQTLDNDYHLFKTDILTGQCTYSTDKNLAANVETISARRAKEIIQMNKRGEKPLSLQEDGKAPVERKPVDLLAEADLTRFDKAKKKRKKKPKAKKPAKPAANGAAKPSTPSKQPEQ